MGSDRLRLACFTAASFGVLGVHMPFWPGWLEHRGLSAVEIGELGMVYMCTRGVASPMWAHFVDRSGRRKLWLIAFTLGAVVCFAPFAWAYDYPALLALTILFGIAHAPVLPLGENLLVLQARERGIDYGRTRLWGSVAFMGASLGAGMLLDDGSWSRTWWLVLLALALSAAAALALPADPTGPRKRAVGVPLAELLGNRRALAVLAGGGIVQSAHSMYYMFSTLHWEESGHSTRLIGALWAEAVVAETLFFAFARQLGGRGSERYLMLFAVLAGAIRWSVLASTTSVVPVVGAQLLHALTFAAAHLAVVRHLQHAVPERLSASAQSLYGALNIGAHALVLSFITPLYASSGATAYWPMIAVGAVGGALALWGMSSRTMEWRG